MTKNGTHKSTLEVETPAAPSIEAEETVQAAAPAAETFESTETESAESEETEGAAKDKTKKLISLRVPLEDLGRAKVLAHELRIGYQTLLLQIINDGLNQQEAQNRVKKLTENIKSSLPSLKAAEELANSPAVQAAKDLLEHPTVKAAQELVSNPVLKAAEDLKGNAQLKAAQDFANARAQELAHLPAVQTVQALASTTTAKMIEDFAGSQAFKSAESLLASVKEKAAQHQADGVASEELKALSKSVEDIQAALKKAGLL
jgi:predicted DNA binding CopG/RHH family protein